MRQPLILDMRANGAGDVITAACITHGANLSGRYEAALAVQGGQVDIARMLGQPTGSPALARDVRPSYGLELALGPQRVMHRAKVWALGMGCTADPVPPPLRPSSAPMEAMREWRRKADEMGRRLALLFVRSTFPTRTWPQANMIDLATLLHAAGYLPLALDGDRRLVEGLYPFWAFGYGWESLGALCLLADVVVSSDSAGVHLGGISGTPTVGLWGATDPWVVSSLYPSVRPVRVARSVCGCVGCHFRGERGWRRACDAGCQALARLTPAAVLDEVLSACPPNPGGETHAWVDPARSPLDALDSHLPHGRPRGAAGLPLHLAASPG